MLLRLAAGFGILALASTTALAGTIEGPLQIIVSRDQQTLKVYDGDTVVASSNVSSGKEGHTTPTGIFSILEKKRMHHSNIYDEAPMPFMQRLTWSGIALHASSHVPAYPASHGCVRMPDDFARMLYRLTRRGGHVLITGGDVAPHVVEHPALFQPEGAEPEAQLLSDAALRRAAKYASGWWCFLTPPEKIAERIDFIKSQDGYDGRPFDVVHGLGTNRVGEGHEARDDPHARPGMSEAEIVDRLGWLAAQGVTVSSVPIPPVGGVQEYLDYAQWVIETVKPQLPG